MENFSDGPRRPSPQNKSKLQSMFNKKKDTNPEESKQNYLGTHECHLPSDKVHANQIKCGKLRGCLLNLTSVHIGDIRAVNLYKSYSAIRAEKYRQYKFYPLSIHPFCKLRVRLEAIIVFTAILTSLLLAIDNSQRDPKQTYFALYIVYLINESFYILNIILNFFTGYVEGNTRQYVILDLKKIGFHYMRTWLLTDVISTLPFLRLFKLCSDSVKIYCYLPLHLMKVLRTPILLKYLNNVLVVSRIGIFGKTIIQICVLTFSYLIWNTYFQLSVEYLNEGSFTPAEPQNCSWISVAKLWNVKSSLKFAYTLERAIGMLRKNANINLVEKAGCFENFFIVAWIIAEILVYHCMFKFMVYLFGKDSARAKYSIMTQQVTALMNQRKFPPRIKEKILKFYAIRFQSHYFAEAQMLKCVTGQLHEDIIMHTGRQLVREVEFLKMLPRSLLLQIGHKLKIVIFIAGDIILKINGVGECMYFIDKGTVAVYTESGCEICHMEDGDYFGEVELVTKYTLRAVSVVAVTNCELFRLDKEDFDSTLARYPTVYEKLKKIAINRHENSCVIDERHKAELKMAEDHLMKKYTFNSGFSQ